MRRCAKEGTCLAELVKAAIPVCQQAERECPRTGPGRKPEIADWVMTVLIMVAVMKRRKSKSAQYRFLDQHRRPLMEWLGIDRFPSRTTYFDRYRRVYRLYEQAVRIEGTRAVAHGLADARCLAVDQSVVRARGPRWSKRRVKLKKVPKGADLEATWTYSDHHGWVLGYIIDRPPVARGGVQHVHQGHCQHLVRHSQVDPYKTHRSRSAQCFSQLARPDVKCQITPVQA